MTSFSGGKQKIGKKLAQVIADKTKELKFDVKGYCEPFCGMLGVFQHIPDYFSDLEYKAGDINNSITKMWQSAQQDFIPPTIVTEDEYNKLKNGIDSAERGYVGHQYGFGGKFFKGYAPKYGKNIDSTSASNNVVRIGKKLKDVKFTYGDYTQFSDLDGYIIYCDPPYGNTECHYLKKFNSEDFHNWCRMMSEKNLVFVSEYNAPKDFTEIWSKSIKLSGVSKSEGKHISKVRTERLFITY
jgi:DNA adenine methylase